MMEGGGQDVDDVRKMTRALTVTDRTMTFTLDDTGSCQAARRTELICIVVQTERSLVDVGRTACGSLGQHSGTTQGIPQARQSSTHKQTDQRYQENEWILDRAFVCFVVSQSPVRP